MVDKQLILDSVGQFKLCFDAHDGIVNVVDTTDGIITISLEGGYAGCGSTPMTAMQIYYSLMKLEDVNDIVFLNGELPEYMRQFIDENYLTKPMSKTFHRYSTQILSLFEPSSNDVDLAPLESLRLE